MIPHFKASKKSFNISCKANKECDDSEGLICLNETCSCNTTQYWNQTINTCVNKKTINDSCLLFNECNDINGLNCTTSMCLCDIYNYWSTKNFTCGKL